MSKIQQNTFIVICDGKTAKLYINQMDNEINLKESGTLSLDYLNDKGPSILPNETLPNEKREENFAKHIATDLYKRAHDGDYEHLILIADPQTLGQIRPILHDEVRSKIVLELPKELTNSSVKDIEQILAKALNEN